MTILAQQDRLPLATRNPKGPLILAWLGCLPHGRYGL